MFGFLRAAGAAPSPSSSGRCDDPVFPSGPCVSELPRDNAPRHDTAADGHPYSCPFHSDTRALCATERQRRAAQSSSSSPPSAAASSSAFSSDGVLLHWMQHLYQEHMAEPAVAPLNIANNNHNNNNNCSVSGTSSALLSHQVSRTLEYGMLWSRLLTASSMSDSSSWSSSSASVLDAPAAVPAHTGGVPLHISPAHLRDVLLRYPILEEGEDGEASQFNRPRGRKGTRTTACDGGGGGSGGVIRVLQDVANPSLAALFLSPSPPTASVDSSYDSFSSSSISSSDDDIDDCFFYPAREQGGKQRKRERSASSTHTMRIPKGDSRGPTAVMEGVIESRPCRGSRVESAELQTITTTITTTAAVAERPPTHHQHDAPDKEPLSGSVSTPNTSTHHPNTADNTTASLASAAGVPRLPSGNAKNSFRIKFSGYRAPSPPPPPPPTTTATTTTPPEPPHKGEGEVVVLANSTPSPAPPQEENHHPSREKEPYEEQRWHSKSLASRNLSVGTAQTTAPNPNPNPNPPPGAAQKSISDVANFLSAFTSLPAGGVARSSAPSAGRLPPPAGMMSANGFSAKSTVPTLAPPAQPQQQQQPPGRWDRKSAPGYSNSQNKNPYHSNNNNAANHLAGGGGFITAGEQLMDDVEAGRTNSIHAANFRTQQLRSPALGLRRSGFQAPFQLPNPAAGTHTPQGNDPSSAASNNHNQTNSMGPCPPGNHNRQNNNNNNNNTDGTNHTNKSASNSSSSGGGGGGDGDGNRFDIADYPKCVLLPDGTLPPSLQSLDPKLVHQVVMEIVEYRAIAAESHNINSNGEEAPQQESKPPAKLVSWDDIAGLADAKRSVEEAIVWPLRRPDLFVGLRDPPRGLLLFGPPGTGKTLIARAIASRAQCTFFNISAASLMSKWYGEAEQLVRCLFTVATVKQPSVIFVDEVDSLLSMRGDGENDAERRLKTEFLVQMDGVGTHSTDRVLLIGATNRPDELDEAARRRLEKRLYIPLPNAAARRELIQRLLFTLQQDYDQRHMGDGAAPKVHALSDNDLTRLVEATEGYSGADLRLLCREAAMAPLREASKLLDWQQLSLTDLRPLQRRDFKAALRRMKPSVGPSEVVRYEKWNRLFGSFGEDSAEEQQQQRTAAAAASTAATGGGGTISGDEDSDDDSDKEWII